MRAPKTDASDVRHRDAVFYIGARLSFFFVFSEVCVADLRQRPDPTVLILRGFHSYRFPGSNETLRGSRADVGFSRFVNAEMAIWDRMVHFRSTSLKRAACKAGFNKYMGLGRILF